MLEYINKSLKYLSSSDPGLTRLDNFSCKREVQSHLDTFFLFSILLKKPATFGSQIPLACDWMSDLQSI